MLHLDILYQHNCLEFECSQIRGSEIDSRNLFSIRQIGVFFSLSHSKSENEGEKRSETWNRNSLFANI